MRRSRRTATNASIYPSNPTQETDMAELGAVTIKVTPDFSAFREATHADITAEIAVLFPKLSIAEIDDVAKAVVDHFTVFPKH